MTNVIITRATQEEMADVARVFKASRQHALPYLPTLHSSEEDLNYFQNVIFKNEVIVIAKDSASQKIVGFIAFSDDFVNHLYLLPEVQRVGLGTKLVNIAKEHSPRLKLWTFQKNITAQRFYEKNGFLILKKTDGKENEEKEPDVLMEWSRS